MNCEPGGNQNMDQVTYKSTQAFKFSHFCLLALQTVGGDKTET
jgi:hypothetical protein